MKKLVGFVAGMMMLASAAVPAFASTNQVVETNHGYVSYHAQPRLHSSIVGRLTLGEKTPLVKKANRYWYEIQVNGRDVYITTSRRFTHVATVTNGTSPVTTPPTTTQPPVQPIQSSVTLTAQQQKLVDVAKSQLGVPYVWGHQDPGVGFDCSNFVAWVYKDALGIDFSGSSVYQRYHVGTPVSLNDLQPGDILFFANPSASDGSGHVGMYIGNRLLIQEGGGRGKVTIESLDNSRAWFGRSLVFARRVLN